MIKENNNMTHEYPMFETPDIWVPFLEEMVDRMRDIDPNITFMQIKEKFGTLRVYFRCLPELEDKMREIEEEYYQKLQQICYKCGSAEEVQVGKNNRTFGYVVPRCKTHRNEDK